MRVVAARSASACLNGWRGRVLGAGGLVGGLDAGGLDALGERREVGDAVLELADERLRVLTRTRSSPSVAGCAGTPRIVSSTAGASPPSCLTSVASTGRPPSSPSSPSGCSARP